MKNIDKQQGNLDLTPLINTGQNYLYGIAVAPVFEDESVIVSTSDLKEMVEALKEADSQLQILKRQVKETAPPF